MKCTPANRMISASTDCALDRQRKRIAQEVGRLLYFGQRIVMGQYDGVFLAFQFFDPIPDLRGVINLHFLFLLFNLILIKK